MAKSMSTLARLRVFQKLNRDWRGHLSASEFSLLSYLLDATVSYGRVSISLTLDQMANGAERRDGTGQWLQPCGLTVPTIRRGLARLRELGLVTSSQVSFRRTPTYTIDTEWELPMDKLPTPKRLNPGARKDPEKVDSGMQNLFIPKAGRYEKNEHLQNNIKGGKVDSRRASAPTDAPRTAEQVIADVKAKPKKETKRDREQSIRTIWRESWSESGLGLPPALSAKDRGQLTMFRNRLPSGDKMLAWAIINWRRIMADQFGWMTQREPPDLPNPGFMLTHALTFIEAFTTEEQQRVRQTLTGDERIIAELVASGMSVESAWQELGRRKAEHSPRFEEERRRIAATVRALEQEREHIRRTGGQSKPSKPVDKIDPQVYRNDAYDTGDSNIRTDFDGFDDTDH